MGSAPFAKAADEATFYLESIEIANARPSVAEIVLSQSLLKQGSLYSEADLRDALSRIRRLPFVRDAELALLKGSHRGAYTLRISVETMSLLFVQAASSLALFRETVHLRQTGQNLFENGAAVGLRGFLGRQGVLFAGAGTAGSAYGEIGYTQYDLFGTGGYAAADLQYSRSGSVLILPFIVDPSISGWGVDNTFAGRLAIGIPISGNHSIRARYVSVEAQVRRLEPVFTQSGGQEETGDGGLSLDQANLDWLYDTTDDAVLPTRGLFLAAGAGVLRGDTPETFQIVPGPSGQPTRLAARIRRNTRTGYVSLSATRYLPVTPRHTMLASLEGYAGPTKVDHEASETTFRFAGSLGHSANLWSSEKTREIGDLRLETAVEYNYEKAPPAPAPFYPRFERLRVKTGVALKNSWALLRFGLSYTVFDRGRR